MTDYIIIGGGLAGLAFAETALSNGKTIHVFENDSLHSSEVAAGVYNPVILKRFSGLADAQEQLDRLQAFYSAIESRLGVRFNFPTPIFRRFASIEEQNNWFVAMDKPALSGFLSDEVQTEDIDGIYSPFGFGKVLQTGFLDTKTYLASYREWLRSESLLTDAAFDYDKLELFEDYVRYGDLQARHIVFAEGFGIRQNPYFNHLPLNGTKGELLTVSVPGLDLKKIIKSSVFLLPDTDGNFKVGATYEWEDKTETPTASARDELEKNLREFLHLPYEIVGHKAGIRPTVKDRKPLLGTHPEHKSLHVMNGLGTRGVMLAPFCADLLYDFIENGKAIPQPMSASRF